MKNSGAILAVITVVSVLAVVKGKPANNGLLQDHHIDIGLTGVHSEHDVNIIRREVLLSDVELNESPVVYEGQFNANKLRLRRQQPTATQPTLISTLLNFVTQPFNSLIIPILNRLGYQPAQSDPSKNEVSPPNTGNPNPPATGTNGTPDGTPNSTPDGSANTGTGAGVGSGTEVKSG